MVVAGVLGETLELYIHFPAAVMIIVVRFRAQSKMRNASEGRIMVVLSIAFFHTIYNAFLAYPALYPRGSIGAVQ